MAYETYQKLRNSGLSHEEAVRRMSSNQSDTSWKNLPGNILPSAGRAVKDIFSAGVNVFNTNPEENTIANIFRVGAGGVSKLIPGRQGSEDAFDATVGFFKDRYGGPERLKQTLVNDPTGAALDVASLLTGAGGAVRGGASVASKVGVNASRASKVGRIGSGLMKAGDAIDPIVQGSKLAGKAVSKVAPQVGRFSADVVGSLTGTGGEAVKQAFLSRSDDFRQALRGKISEAKIVDNTLDALSTLRANRAAEYQKALSEISKSKKTLDLTPLHEKLRTQLESFGVQFDPETRTFDFARSTISDGAEANRVQGAVEAIAEWGSRSEDLTPKGVDLLKRKLDDFYSPSKEAGAFVAPLRQEVKKILTKNVDGYEDMVRKYAEASDLIGEIRRVISERGSSETIFKKLLLSLKQNQEARLAFIKELQKASDTDIIGQVSGISMNQWIPRGIIGKGAAIGAGVGLGFGTIQFLLAAGISSPRLVAEFLQLVGVPAKQIPKLTNFYSTILEMGADRALFQADKLNDAENLQESPEEISSPQLVQ